MLLNLNKAKAYIYSRQIRQTIPNFGLFTRLDTIVLVCGNFLLLLHH